jgi:UDP-glucose 4-epimerase
MRVLVTGGAGYVGSHCVEELVAIGHEVVVLDNLSVGHRAAVHPDASFVLADLTDLAAVQAAFSRYRPAAVMHFAAHTLVGESMTAPLKYLGENVLCAVNLFQAMVEHDVRRFILSSTANLFDRPARVPIAEDEAIVPGSPYGESKAIIERQLYWLDQTHGLRYAALRYFNAAGASPGGQRGEDHRPEHHLIPIVLQVALGQRDGLTVNGRDYPTPDGTCVRDYIHVNDLAQAHILALAALDKGSRAYNLGNGQGYSILEVIEAARAVTGRDIPFTYGPRRSGDPAVLVADATRVRAELGWSPRFPDLQDIVATAWAWHNTHPHGYEAA